MFMRTAAVPHNGERSVAIPHDHRSTIGYQSNSLASCHYSQQLGMHIRNYDSWALNFTSISEAKAANIDRSRFESESKVCMRVCTLLNSFKWTLS